MIIENEVKMLEIDSIPLCRENLRLQVTNCQYDSRLIEEGGLFFAIKGKKNDGHVFLKEIAEKKALAAVVDQTYSGEDFGLFLYRSKNVRVSLQMMAKELLEKRNQKVIAITGSVGKTTTKEFIYSILKDCFSVYKSPGNFNSQVSLPLNILNSPKNADVLILEMGMSQKNEIEKLVNIAPPTLALITKVALAHAGNFKEGIYGIAKEKLFILSHNNTKKKIINHDLLKFKSVKGVKTFSIKEKSANYFLKIENDMIKIFENNIKKLEMKSPFYEMHFLEDMIAAIAVAREMNVNFEKIFIALKNLILPPLRGEKIKKNDILFINDCYNANLASTEAALVSLSEYQNKKIAVLGEMKELGDFSLPCHEKIANIALKYVDEVVCYGKDTFVIFEIFQKQKKMSKFFIDKNEMISFLKKHLKKNDVVLIKGSRSCGLELIVDLL